MRPKVEPDDNSAKVQAADCGRKLGRERVNDKKGDGDHEN